MTSLDVRSKLVEALHTDLVGPSAGSALESETIGQAPSRWYLTGFLVPYEAPASHKSDETGNEQLDLAERGGDDNTVPEAQARAKLLPLVDGLEHPRPQGDDEARRRGHLGHVPAPP